MCCPVLQAADKLRQAFNLSPQTVTYVQLGRVHLLRGSVESAIEVYRKALR